MLKQKQDLV